jgi:hypothetical protein
MRATFIPLLRPTVEETLAKALADAERASFNLLKLRRQMCMDYYHNEVLLEDGGYDAYLKNMSGVLSKDGWIYKNVLLLEHVNLTEQVIDLKSRIYREQPVRTVSGNEAENYTALLDSSGWQSISKRLEQYTNLLHDVACGVFYNKNTKRLQFQVVPEYIPIFDEEDDLQIDPVAIVCPTAKRDPVTGGVIWVYYDATQRAELDSTYRLRGGIQPNTYGVFNFFFPHRKYPVLNHFSTPAVNLVGANQAVDAAMTALNQLLHYNGFKQLVIKGKVAKENDQGLEVKFGLGNAQAIVLEPNGEGTVDGDVSTLDMQVDFNAHIGAIKSKMEMVANQYNIQFQWSMTGDIASGAAFEMQNVRDYEDRRGQFDILMDFTEKPLYSIVSAISDRFGLGVEKGDISVNFAEPKTEMSVPDKVAWQRWMIESGQWDEADLIVENNPELTREEALARLNERDAQKLIRREKMTPPQLQGTQPDQNMQDNQPNQQQSNNQQ